MQLPMESRHDPTSGLSPWVCVYVCVICVCMNVCLQSSSNQRFIIKFSAMRRVQYTDSGIQQVFLFYFKDPPTFADPHSVLVRYPRSKCRLQNEYSILTHAWHEIITSPFSI